MAKSRKKRRQPHQRPPKAKQRESAADRPKERKQPRAERIAAAQQASRRRSRLLRAGVVMLVVAILGALVVWQVASRRATQRNIAAMTAGTCEYDTESDPGRAGEHVSNPSFSVNPPSGGVHTPAVASAGRYNEQNAPPDGQAVHSLEHGYVVLWYRPDLPEDQVAVLEQLFENNDEDVLVVPRANMPVPVAATAWQRRLLCDEVERESLARFISEFVGKGPEKVPRG
ncbi:MAG: DUF3105 domain-containing protein [Actinobacteria bacterium]|nr:DUF3105 domain-containing protein [Actinomycetota bacterium]